MTLKGYVQSHQVDYFLGSGMSTPPVPNIRYAGVSGPNPGPVTIQAETAALAGGAVVESNRAGFNGTGFVNFPATGGSAQMQSVNGGAGGVRTLRIRFANGGATARTGRLRINGASQGITFGTTGGWTNWATLDVAVTLTSGSSNTLRFESSGQDLANLDEVSIQ